MRNSISNLKSEIKQMTLDNGNLKNEIFNKNEIVILF
jgi:hypothetical protein